MPLSIVVNGKSRCLEELAPGVSLRAVITALGLQADRVAVERNGEIARRPGWDNLAVENADRLEVVHFVGGGVCVDTV